MFFAAVQGNQRFGEGASAAWLPPGVRVILVSVESEAFEADPPSVSFFSIGVFRTGILSPAPFGTDLFFGR